MTLHTPRCGAWGRACSRVPRPRRARGGREAARCPLIVRAFLSFLLSFFSGRALPHAPRAHPAAVGWGAGGGGEEACGGSQGSTRARACPPGVALQRSVSGLRGRDSSNPPPLASLLFSWQRPSSPCFIFPGPWPRELCVRARVRAYGGSRGVERDREKTLFHHPHPRCLPARLHPLSPSPPPPCFFSRALFPPTPPSPPPPAALPHSLQDCTPTLYCTGGVAVHGLARGAAFFPWRSFSSPLSIFPPPLSPQGGRACAQRGRLHHHHHQTPHASLSASLYTSVLRFKGTRVRVCVLLCAGRAKQSSSRGAEESARLCPLSSPLRLSPHSPHATQCPRAPANDIGSPPPSIQCEKAREDERERDQEKRVFERVWVGGFSGVRAPRRSPLPPPSPSYHTAFSPHDDGRWHFFLSGS